MKKILSFIKANIFISISLYIILFGLINNILSGFNYMFRQWVYSLNIALIMVGFIAGTIQLVFKSSGGKKVVFIGFFIIILISIFPIFFKAYSNSFYMPEYILEKDNKKYVAYVSGIWDTYVDYYEYKGPFIISRYKSIREYYGEGGFDPIKDNNYGYKIYETTYYDSEENILKVVKEETEEKPNIITSDNVKIIEENSKYYASAVGKEKVQIISPKEAADIADIEAKNNKYQYQSWGSEFYSRGKENNETLSAKLCYGLEEIDKLYIWEESWKVEDYENKLMWQIRLFDENDPLTSLFIYVDAQNKNIIGAGQMSD